MSLVLLGAAVLVHGMTPHRDEPWHRTPLPLWIKLPAIMAVVVTIIILKESMLGFMTTFPMVGVVTAYEARHSLRAVCRQLSVALIALAPMAAVVRIAQPRLGLGLALVAGWGIFLCLLPPLTLAMWAAAKAAPTTSQPGKQATMEKENADS